MTGAVVALVLAADTPVSVCTGRHGQSSRSHQCGPCSTTASSCPAMDKAVTAATAAIAALEDIVQDVAPRGALITSAIASKLCRTSANQEIAC